MVELRAKRNAKIRMWIFRINVVDDLNQDNEVSDYNFNMDGVE